MTHQTMKKTDESERQRVMRTLLRRMAVEVDPGHARLTALADAMHVNLQTVLRWITVGRVTSNRAAQLNEKFGDELADIATLTGKPGGNS